MLIYTYLMICTNVRVYVSKFFAKVQHFFELAMENSDYFNKCLKACENNVTNILQCQNLFITLHSQNLLTRLLLTRLLLTTLLVV